MGKARYEVDSIDLKPYANHFFEVGHMANIPRSGLPFLGWHSQSVSEHVHRTIHVGEVLAHLEIEAGSNVDINRVIMFCLYHDYGEQRTGDPNYVNKLYVTVNKFKAVQDATRGLSKLGEEILAAHQEVEEGRTIEAIITKDADYLEWLVTLKEIMDRGNPLPTDWVTRALKRLRRPIAIELAEEILRTKCDEWWFGNKNDPHWVTGGKTISGTE